MSRELLTSPDFLQAELRLAQGGFRLDVSCRTRENGVVGVFGPSGAGKSTLLRCLAGLEPRCVGAVRLGAACWQDSARGLFVPPHRRGVGFVFQDSRLFPHLDVVGNLDYAHRRSPQSERRLGFDEVVGWLDLAPLLKRSPASLSGGERQRVALGRSLLSQPRLLLLDEPLAALDLRRRQETLPYLKRLRDELMMPIIYVSHNLDELVECADELLLMEQGRSVSFGPIFEQLGRVDSPLAQHEEAGALIEAVVTEHDERYHLSYLALGTQRLVVGRQICLVGQTVRMRIHARDVALSLDRPRSSTLLNIIEANVDTLAAAAAAGQVLVKLDVEGQALLARITRKSADALELRAGTRVYALVKSVALMR